MDRRQLTERLISELPPAPARKRTEVFDVKMHRLAVRVTDRGEKSFILYARFPRRPDTPTRRRLGRHPELSLESARRKAREWLDLIERGTDPADEEERRQHESAATRNSTFAVAAEEFIRQRVVGVRHYDKLATIAAAYLRDHPHQKLTQLGAIARVIRPSGVKCNMRKASAVIRDIDGEFISRWGNRPISAITQRDVRAVIAATIKRGAPYRAFALLTHAKMLFKFAVAHDEYGLLVSPCANLSALHEVGRKRARERVLSDAELCALWHAAAELGYPYGPLLQMLALTGQRKSDVADARWREFDAARKTWTIPAARMKMETAHVVLLSDEVLSLLEKLPRFEEGDCLFSFTFGAKPPNSFSKAKASLEERMGAALGSFESFVIHDIRRTVRTRLVGLRVPPHVAELVIAHVKPGMSKVYDLHAYDDEKREALQAWAAELRTLVS
jgi:integrase